MRIAVALDGSKRRDLTLYPGDEVSLDVVVYERDGDAEPLDASSVTNARFVTGLNAGAAFSSGASFTVSTGAPGRSRYRLVAEVDGLTTTLAEGVLVLRGVPCLPWWWCCAGYPVLVPVPVALPEDGSLLLESGESLTTEDGFSLLLEDGGDSLLLEDGSFLAAEDGLGLFLEA